MHYKGHVNKSGTLNSFRRILFVLYFFFVLKQRGTGTVSTKSSPMLTMKTIQCEIFRFVNQSYIIVVVNFRI
jgi:hypothetical protein